MRVLEIGRPQKGWATKRRCTGYNNDGGGCGALLLVDESDLTALKSTDMYGDTNYHALMFTCVACGVKTDLTDITNDPGAFPHMVWKRIWAEQNKEKG